MSKSAMVTTFFLAAVGAGAYVAVSHINDGREKPLHPCDIAFVPALMVPCSIGNDNIPSVFGD